MKISLSAHLLQLSSACAIIKAVLENLERLQLFMNICVLGAGTWGIALSALLSKNGHAVTVWSAIENEIAELSERGVHKNLPGVILPKELNYTVDIASAISGCEMLLFAVPSEFIRQTARRAAPYLTDGIIIVNDCEISPMSVVIGNAKYPENIIEELRKTHTVYTIDGKEIAKSLGNSKVLNSVVLGLGAKYIGFSEQEWLDVLKSTVPPKTVDVNVLAFKAGYEK
jgi:glycerol-3-phosphate dehydrogenase